MKDLRWKAFALSTVNLLKPNSLKESAIKPQYTEKHYKVVKCMHARTHTCRHVHTHIHTHTHTHTESSRTFLSSTLGSKTTALRCLWIIFLSVSSSTAVQMRGVEEERGEEEGERGEREEDGEGKKQGRRKREQRERKMEREKKGLRGKPKNLISRSHSE